MLLVVSVPVVARDSAPAPIVSLDYDSAADFNNYRTYSWVTPIPAGLDPVDYERVRTSIDRALASRFTKAAPGEPGDFAIAFLGTANRSGEYRGSYQSEGGFSSILSINIYDTSTKRPIWHGVVRSTRGDLDDAVNRMMNRFPPSHGCDRSPGAELFEKCPP
jgi:hypothetical protein